MSRTLWLHLGAYKAGSSRIQQESWHQRDDLRRQGWLYPQTGLATDEPDVGHRHAHLVYHHRYEDQWPILLDNLVAEVDASDGANVLLSAEAWSDPRSSAALSDMLTVLRRSGVVSDVRGVLYLRNRYAYAHSLYREMTRRRANTLPFHQYIALPRRRRMLDPLVVVRKLIRTVAPGELTTYPYEGTDDIGQHFFKLLGLTATPQNQRVNTSLDALEVEAYRQLKQRAPELLGQWPGLYALTSRDRWPSDVTERLEPDQLTIEDGWRRRFRRLTGWSRDDVDRLLERPSDSGRDVLTYSDELRDLIDTWAHNQSGTRQARSTTTNPSNP